MPPVLTQRAACEARNVDGHIGRYGLLAALGNVANTQATLDMLSEHKRAIDDAIVANNAAAATATQAQAALSDLEARAQDVTGRETAVAAARTAV